MQRLRILAVVVCFLVLVVITAGCGGPVTTPTPTPTPTPPHIPMALYESTEHGFSVKYPEGWTKNELGIRTQFSLQFKDLEGRLTEDVWVQYRTEEIILTNYVTEFKEYMEATPQYELISEGDVAIGEGISGYEIVGKRDLGTVKVEKFRYVMFVRRKQGFLVGVHGEPAAFDQQEQLIDIIVNSPRLLPTYTFVPPTPGGPGGTYTSAEHGFSITYPEGWMEVPTSRPGYVISLASTEGLVRVSVSPVGEGTSLAEFGPQLSQDLSQHWGDYELVSKGEITLDDGTPAYEIVFTGIREGYNLKSKYVIVIQGAQAFFIMGFSEPARFEQDEAALDEVIHSFHLE